MAWLGGIPPRITPSAHIKARSGDLQSLPPPAGGVPTIGADIVSGIPIEPAAGGEVDEVRFIDAGILAAIGSFAIGANEAEAALAYETHPFAERPGHRLTKQGIIVGHKKLLPGESGRGRQPTASDAVGTEEKPPRPHAGA